MSNDIPSAETPQNDQEATTAEDTVTQVSQDGSEQTSPAETVEQPKITGSGFKRRG